MSSERPGEFSDTQMSSARPIRDDRRSGASDHETSDEHGPSDEAASQAPAVLVRGETVRVRDKGPESQGKDSPVNDGASSDGATHQSATVLVRGETVSDQGQKSQSNDPQSNDPQSKDPQSKESAPKDKEKSPRKEISEAKVKLQKRLPALDDDPDIGRQKEQTVIRDGKADLSFTGSLLASAAPPLAPKGKWQEYRIYATNGGKHVFSKVGRSVYAEDPDTHEAEVFDPSPSSVPSQLLRSARDLARSKPLTWMDAAVAFFGYDPLSKVLYRKLGGQFEEHIS
jgi:hypothetical protein